MRCPNEDKVPDRFLLNNSRISKLVIPDKASGIGPERLLLLRFSTCKCLRFSNSAKIGPVRKLELRSKETSPLRNVVNHRRVINGVELWYIWVGNNSYRYCEHKITSPEVGTWEDHDRLCYAWFCVSLSHFLLVYIRRGYMGLCVIDLTKDHRLHHSFLFCATCYSINKLYD